MIEAVELLDQLGKELTGFLCHWRTIPKNDFLSEVYKLLELEPWKKLLPFLQNLLQILRGNDYNPKIINHFFAEPSPSKDSQVYMLSREKANEELKKVNPTVEIERIEKSISSQSEINNLGKKLKNIPISEQKEYFINHCFPPTDKTPHWSEILRVTDCEHCPHYRLFVKC